MITANIIISCQYPGCSAFIQRQKASSDPRDITEDLDPPEEWMLIQQAGKDAMLFCPKHPMRLEIGSVKFGSERKYDPHSDGSETR